MGEQKNPNWRTGWSLNSNGCWIVAVCKILFGSCIPALTVTALLFLVDTAGVISADAGIPSFWLHYQNATFWLAERFDSSLLRDQRRVLAGGFSLCLIEKSRKEQSEILQSNFQLNVRRKDLREEVWAGSCQAAAFSLQGSGRRTVTRIFPTRKVKSVQE